MNAYLVCFMFVVIDTIKERMCTPNITLRADTWQVNFGGNTTLYCDYAIGGEPVISVKFYRGNGEFYRYNPSQNPKTRTFPILKSRTTVDLTRSNETQVTLTDIGYELNGPIKCEVTIDETYKVIFAQKNLTVISLPKHAPVIVTNKERYKINDTFIANCTSSLSNPPSSLSFLLNNEPVGTPSSKEIGCNKTQNGFPTIRCENKDNTTSWTWLPLNITLSEEYFANDYLNLECTAVVHTFRHSSKKAIPTKSTEPKLEGVTSFFSSSSYGTHISYQLVGITLIGIFSR